MKDNQAEMNKVTQNIHFCRETGRLIHGNAEMTLSEKERVLFSVFIAQKNINISKEEIIKLVWKERYAVTTDTNLTQLVYRLRRSLQPTGLGTCIKTVPRMGYVFMTDELQTEALTEYHNVHEKINIGRIFKNIILKAISLMFFFSITFLPGSTEGIQGEKIQQSGLLAEKTRDNFFKNKISYPGHEKVFKVTIEVDTQAGSYVYNFLPRTGENNL